MPVTLPLPAPRTSHVDRDTGVLTLPIHQPGEWHEEEVRLAVMAIPWRLQSLAARLCYDADAQSFYLAVQIVLRDFPTLRPNSLHITVAEMEPAPGTGRSLDISLLLREVDDILQRWRPYVHELHLRRYGAHFRVSEGTRGEHLILYLRARLERRWQMTLTWTPTPHISWL